MPSPSRANSLAAYRSAAWFDTSAVYAHARPPLERICSAAAATLSASMSTSPTVAPSRANLTAIASPRPRAAPVIRTDCSASSGIRSTWVPLEWLELGRIGPHSPLRVKRDTRDGHRTLSKDKGSGGGRVLSYALTAALAGAATGEAQANE